MPRNSLPDSRMAELEDELEDEDMEDMYEDDIFADLAEMFARSGFAPAILLILSGVLASLWTRRKLLPQTH